MKDEILRVASEDSLFRELLIQKLKGKSNGSLETEEFLKELLTMEGKNE